MSDHTYCDESRRRLTDDLRAASDDRARFREFLRLALIEGERGTLDAARVAFYRSQLDESAPPTTAVGGVANLTADLGVLSRRLVGLRGGAA